MDVEWVVAVGAASMLTGLTVGWWRCRRLQSQASEAAARHELRTARLRGELSASAGHVAAARAEAAAARAAVSAALLESGRLEQKLAEHRATSVSTAEFEAARDTQQRLRHELITLRRELATLAPMTEELSHHRDFIESLQRELSYRDERLLALEDAQLGAGPVALAGVNGSPRPEPDVIDLTVDDPERSATAGNGRGDGTRHDDDGGSSAWRETASSTGQRRHDGVGQPGTEEVIERAARNA